MGRRKKSTSSENGITGWERSRATPTERSSIDQSIRGIPLSELLEMARRHLVDRESADEVCGDRFKPQQFRQALFEARRRGLLRQFVILTPELDNIATLDSLAREVEEAARRFRPQVPLRVHLVFGDRETYDRTQSIDPREFLKTQDERDIFLRNQAVVDRIIDSAIDWISREILPSEVFIPAWGSVVRKLVGGLRPWEVRSRLTDVTVVAGSGLVGVRAFADFEAGNNARLAGEIFGTSRVHLMPLPFCVPGDASVYEGLRQLKPVRDAEDWLKRGSMVVTSLQDFSPSRYSIVRHGLMDEASAQKYADAGACGEIAGVPFDASGAEVAVAGFQFAGIRPHDLMNIAGTSESENPKIDKHDRRKREVVALAGATASRTPALAIAIRSGLVTRLFTDHVTAQALLRIFEEV